MEKSTLALGEGIVEILSEKKAYAIESFDLGEKSAIADRFTIASASSSRQLRALAESVAGFLKRSGVVPIVDGAASGDWVVVDGGFIVVHLMRQEARDYYDLESTWRSSHPYAILP